ncbi:fimbrial protein [Yersinia enterocolitica]|uniref:fimbrial protein n=1 Tax=Yersinia enterocolitica TaxID=630 RepID=UPI0009B5AC82|nr:fimbrial protein [Yersinia enterocolitica]ELI7921278.1 fimbrial protein [Yersinia enterocolitica]HEN3580540.1 fimbrial protein [Yersinia enterocolitica]HEN3613775.1 fimbrial protein [Yersinia enterocolitica]HEN3639321.1 fimbrial protein [Yersinia enterocolitica]HEN3647598.1 fimbrial protein [Yersinia enterocolitica]
MRKNTLILILFCSSVFIYTLFNSHQAHAVATCNPNGAVTITPPSIIVQRDAPIGSQLSWTATPNSVNFTCTGSISSSAGLGVKSYGNYLTNLSGNHNLYSTNIPGIAYSIGVNANGGSYHWAVNTANNERLTLSASGSWDANNFISGGQSYSVAFYKVGPSGSGAMVPMTIGGGRLLLDSTYAPDVPINMTSFNVTTVACSINSTIIQVPLEEVSVGDLTGVGTTAKPKQFDLGLNCDAGARINVKMTGTQNTDSSSAGVLQLTNAGNASVATGVGIQIMYNGAPLSLNNNIVLKTSAGDQETFPFIAQYYQTQNTVTAGDANTTMTLNITYQ